MASLNQDMEDEIQQQLRVENECDARISLFIQSPADILSLKMPRFLKYSLVGQGSQYLIDPVTATLRPYPNCLYKRVWQQLSTRIGRAREAYKVATLMATMPLSASPRTEAIERRVHALYPDWAQMSPDSRRVAYKKYCRYEIRGRRWLQVSQKLSYGCIILTSGQVGLQMYGIAPLQSNEFN
jgi:hypothetical protein